MEKSSNEVKIFITFGSSALPELSSVLDPMKVMLVVSGKDHWEARDKVFKSFVGDNFCTSYNYDEYAESFKDGNHAKEYTLEELEYLAGILN